MERSDAEVCAEFPGFREDGVVTTDTRWLIRWHTGRVPLPVAIKAGEIRFEGPRWLSRLLTDWGRLSPFATIAATSTG